MARTKDSAASHRRLIRPRTGDIASEPDCELGCPIPFPPGLSFPFLNLPSEIRTKIYRMLFRCSVPVYPMIGRGLNGGVKAAPPKTTFPANFLAVNRQIYGEANAVLWGDNQIVFQFPLDFQAADSVHVYYHKEFIPRGVAFMPNPTHLSQIRKLVVEAYLFRELMSNLPVVTPPRPATLVRREIAALCDVLKDGHQLQQLEVRFTNIRPSTNPNYNLQNFGPPEHGRLAGKIGDPFPAGWSPSCCTFSGWGACGRSIERIGQIQEICQQAIEVDQQVLEPLLRLRGVGSVTVVGRVSNEWAQFLKQTMETEAGKEAGTFEHV